MNPERKRAVILKYDNPKRSVRFANMKALVVLALLLVTGVWCGNDRSFDPNFDPPPEGKWNAS